MAGIKQRHLTLVLFFLIFLVAGVVPAWAAEQQNSTIITDAAGRTVTIPTSVKRIIPLGGALRFVTYLQGLDLVVGIEALEKKPVDAGRLYGLAVADRAGKIPAVGEGGPGGKLPDFEQIIAVHPDLIVTMGLDKAQMETIQLKTSIPVLALNSGAITTLDLRQTKESLRLLGRIIDRKERAEALITFIDQLEGDLNRRTTSLRDRPKTYVGAIGFRGKQGITSTEATYAPLAWIHGQNVADAITQQGHVFIDQEKLLLWNPDIIFLDAGGVDKVKDDFQKNPAFYAMLKAVQNGHVFMMPPYNYYYTNIEIALANAYFMGKTLSPDAFTDIDPAAQADAIFDFFIGIKAYGQLKKELYGYGSVVFNTAGIVGR